MSNTTSNEHIEAIAASIFARHGVEFCTAERAGGWTNAVWLTPDSVLRLSTTQDNENLLREARLAGHFPSSVGYPASWETGKTAGFVWSLAQRLPGIPLGEAWCDLHWDEQITALQDLWERAQGVHSVPVTEVAEFVPRRAWFNSTDDKEAETSLVRLTEAGILAPTESGTLRDALKRFWCNLPTAPRVLCHGDLTLGNALWHAGHVNALLDFEFAVIAPVQLDLNHLVKLAFVPPPDAHSLPDADQPGGQQLRLAIQELAAPILSSPGSFDLMMGYAILLELWLLELWLAHPEGEGPLEQWEPLRRLRSLADRQGGYLAALAAD